MTQPKEKIALWQLDQKHKLKDIDEAFKTKSVSPPEIREERKIIREVIETLNNQFPQNSHVKDTVLNRVEEILRTSRPKQKY